MVSILAWISSRTATPCLLNRKTAEKLLEPLMSNILLASKNSGSAYPAEVVTESLLKGCAHVDPVPHLAWSSSVDAAHHRIAIYGDSEKSKKDIPGFIKTYKIDADAAEKSVSEYKTLQAFFTRRLKPGLRPVDQPDNPAHAVNPADSRCVVYPSVEAAHKFWIKGQHFNLGKLMGPGYDTKDHWAHAALAINRLSPSDIHRLHASVSGTVVKIARRGDKFMGSQFAAIHSHMDIMTENDRLVMEFDTEAFGTVVQVMIGASEVGSVMPLVKEGQRVRKGDEVAVFEYGGSIMVTLFGSGAISFDDDLSANSQNGAETLVTFGSSLGRATGRPHAHAPAGEKEHARRQRDEL